ncbi:alpha/beta fold hydrolase [bacterium]|nr:alpha/beta fold hydrolase [bacterium]
MNLLGIIIVSVIVLIVVFSYVMSHYSLKPMHRKKNKSPDMYELPFEEVYFPSVGMNLHGWMIKQPGYSISEKIPLVVLLHGWESNAQGMLPHAKYLYDHGFNLFLYDARGHGDSDPVEYMNLIRFTEDAESAIAYLRTRPDIDSQNIALFGHSMGAATAITLASRHPEIRALVASSSFALFKSMIRDMLGARHLPYFPFGSLFFLFWKWRFSFDPHEWAPGTSIRKITMPVLIAHGRKDELFKFDHFENLWSSASSKIKEQVVLEDGTHRNLYEFSNYKESIIKFLKQNLYNPKIEKQSA